MDAITGWLLLLFLLSCLAQPAAILAGRADIGKISFFLTTGFLVTLTFIVLRKPVSWQGPTLFALDSFHQVGSQFHLSLLQIPLLWLVCWWMSHHSSNQSTSAERVWLLALLMTFLACDDVWLWTITFVGCATLQQSLMRPQKGCSGETALLRGFQWLAILLLTIVMAILSFDFGLSAFSELPEKLASWESFSDMQQAELILASTLGALSIVLMSAVFPISVLRIESESLSDLQPMTLLMMAAFFIKLMPMLAITNVASIYLSLVLLTIITSTICYWGFSEREKSQRAVLMSFLMLGLFGMFAPNNPRMNLLGLEQFLLTVIFWKLWNNEGVTSVTQRWLLTASGFWMIAGLSGWTWAFQASDVIGDNPIVTGLMIGVVALGISVVFTHSLLLNDHNHQFDKQSENALGSSGWLLFSIACLILSTRYVLLQQGDGWFVLPHWQASVGLLAGSLAAYVIMRRPSSSKARQHFAGSFHRLFESHFHVLTTWRAILCVPVGMVTAFDRLLELLKNRKPGRMIRHSESAEPSSSFAWELALGGVSFIVLAGLFLWMKG